MPSKAEEIKYLKGENTRLDGLVKELGASLNHARERNMNNYREIGELSFELGEANKKLTSSYSALGEQQVVINTLVAVVNDLRALLKAEKAEVDRLIIEQNDQS